MPDEPLARSARPERGIPEQTYAAHVGAVVCLASRNAQYVSKHYSGQGDLLVEAVRLAALYHDLGKLDARNQEVLRTNKGKMINHCDAGTAAVMQQPYRNGTAATMVCSHHIGLPDFPDECATAKAFLRDKKSLVDETALRFVTDQRLASYLKEHQRAIGNDPGENCGASALRALSKEPLLFRIALSCLVDADHYDAARHCNDAIPYDGPSLNPADRLALLDQHVKYLAATSKEERGALRTEIYRACRNADTGPGMYACDSPVGTGKTTAVMAHLLKAASDKDLRRVFVVLPFTNIIDQSVGVYRQGLVGLSEDRTDVVAAHHHRAEFDSPESRQFAFLWNAPIVVTTAVQFFETLSSNHPSALRKLHQLPGSAIFIDEAHAALPSHLWPQAWLWLRELTEKWGCHIVLGSGSLTRFWNLEEFSNPPEDLPDLLPRQKQADAGKYETIRINYQRNPDRLDLPGLVSWVKEQRGPRLLILNTVQSAAAVAEHLKGDKRTDSVVHLSTALCPRDRATTLKRIRERLNDESDKDWTLVATSCVEAGVDLSFHTGFRERCGLNSLIQTGGRVNRKGLFRDSVLWDCELVHGKLLNEHPAFRTSAKVLGCLFDENKIGPEFATEAMRREIREEGMRSIAEEITRAERNLRFPFVAQNFNVISNTTMTAIVDNELLERIKAREKIKSRDIQEASVQIWTSNADRYGLEAIVGFEDLYRWTLLYDAFLGYMAGVLPLIHQGLRGYSFV